MPNQYSNKTLDNPIYLGVSSNLFLLAKELRKRTTLPEKILWERLKSKQFNGLKFRRQHPILKFIVDFYCHEKKLVIEVDGGYHLREDQKEYDLGRSYELEQYGIKVIRFTNEEVESDVEKVLDEIFFAIDTP